MPKFRKKPVEIEAVQFNGIESYLDIVEWAKASGYTAPEAFAYRTPIMIIPTLEGAMAATPGDWIIRGVKGEFYPCKPDIFEATYELVEEEEAPKKRESCPTHDGDWCYACEEMWMGKGVCRVHHPDTQGNARAMADLPRKDRTHAP